MPMSKRKFGPSGGTVSLKDLYSRFIPTEDPDLQWDIRRRTKIPPIQIPEDITQEEFVKELKDQLKPYFGMTHSEFKELLAHPELELKRKIRSQRERAIRGMEYHRNIEDQWWREQQSKLMQINDEVNYSQRHNVWEWWLQRIYLKDVRSAIRWIKQGNLATLTQDTEVPSIVIKWLRSDTPENAFLWLEKKPSEAVELFVQYAYKYAQRKEPKKKQAGSMIIVRRIRQLAIQRDFTAMREFCEALQPLRKTPSPPQPKRKRRRKD